jgi:hypothetical protein
MAGDRNFALQSMVNNQLRLQFAALVDLMGVRSLTVPADAKDGQAVPELFPGDDSSSDSDSSSDDEPEAPIGTSRVASLPRSARRECAIAVLGHSLGVARVATLARRFATSGVVVAGQRRTPRRKNTFADSDSKTTNTHAHCLVWSASLAASVQDACLQDGGIGPALDGWYPASITELWEVHLTGSPHIVARVVLYSVRLDPKTSLPCISLSSVQPCWLEATRLGPVIALGRGAPGIPVVGRLMWTVLRCTPCLARCTPDKCVCGVEGGVFGAIRV